MRHGSLFSGIGGFDLAAEWMGWENIFHCELNEFGQKVLKHYWPNATSYHDITQTDFTIHRGTIHILTGGFPCQPYSQAGKRKGKADDRHLWPEMLRAIREIQPRYVVGENVRGLTNWNGGMVFDEVQADLETQGYEVLPFLLPACAVNAPHRRDRIWFVAYTTGERREKWSDRRDGSHKEEEGKGMDNRLKRYGDNRATSDTHSNGLHGSDSEHEINTRKGGVNALDDPEQICVTPNPERFRSPREEYRETRSRQHPQENTGGWWANFPTQPPLRGRNDGLSGQLDGITFPKWRNESIKAYGNAIVPQVALQIFKAIEKMESLNIATNEK